MPIDKKIEEILEELRFKLNNNPDTPTYIGEEDEESFTKAEAQILTLIAEELLFELRALKTKKVKGAQLVELKYIDKRIAKLEAELEGKK